MSLIPTYYRSGSTDELDIYDEKYGSEVRMTLVTGATKFYLGLNAGRLSKAEFDWVMKSVKMQIDAVQRQKNAKLSWKRGSLPRAALSLKNTIDKMLGSM